MTLSIGDDDLPTWERAENLGKANGLSLSHIISIALDRYMASPTDIYVSIAPAAGPGATSADSGGKPILEYHRHPEYGYGWTLYAPNCDDHFMPGGAEEPPIAEARNWLERLQQVDLKEIVVEVGNPEIATGFTGRWLVEPDTDDSRTSEEGWDAGLCWGLALTKRGRIAVYTAHCDGDWPAELHDYDNLSDAADDVPADILARATTQLGERRVVWRDI
jgi:hypothetical protein